MVLEMKRQPTCVASWTQGLLTWCEIQGLDRAALLRCAELDEKDLQRHDARISSGANQAIWEEIQRLRPDDAFGLDFAAFGLRLESYDSLGYLTRSCDDVREAFQMCHRYSRWINEVAEPSMRIEGDRVILTCMPSEGSWPRHFAEARVAMYLTLARSWTGRDWAPRSVRFQHPRPADVSRHTEIFGDRLLFDQEANELELDADILSFPLFTADPKMKALLVERMDEKMRRLPGDDLVNNISRIIASDLPANPPKLEAVAKQLGLGPRTLQRRLATEDTTFQQVADETRQRIAEHYLKERTRSISECSSLVGFSEEAAFRRAFKRWVGVSPRKFRSQSRG